MLLSHCEEANAIVGCIMNMSNRVKEVTFRPVLGAGAVTPGIHCYIWGFAVLEGCINTQQHLGKGYKNGE